MSLLLTYCENCMRSMPAFLQAIHDLQTEYPDDLCVVELGCMAACDVAPAVVLEDSYMPHTTIAALQNELDEYLQQDLDTIAS